MEYTSHTTVYPDGCKVTAYHPVLTPEEYERRHKELERATARFLRHVAEAKAKEKQDNA